MRPRAVPWLLVAALGAAACSAATEAAAPSTSTVTLQLRLPDWTEASVAPPVRPAPTTVVVRSAAPTAPPTTAPADPVRLLFTGDVLMHSPLWRQAERNGGATPDFSPMFAHLAPLVRRADLAVCHLETPIAPPGEAWTTDPAYGVPGEVIDALAATGFSHCSTASNHTFDRGVAGVDATIARFAADAMTQHGMAATPADNEAILINVGGIVVAHVSATYGFDVGVRPRDQPWRTSLIEPAALIATAQRARERGADVVVASLHWGNAGTHRVSDRQRSIADELAASGAIDLVVGHHAHVVQPIERIGSMWVAFGLGNVISNMPTGDPVWGAATRDGIVLEVDIDVAGAVPVEGISARDSPGRATIAGVLARPVWVDRDAGWVVRDVERALLDPELAPRIGGELTASWARTTEVVGAYMPH